MNLHHLRLFRAVARDGTLTGAARTLNLSQSAVSIQLRTLETVLGHDLFERRGRGLLLTEAGRIALDHAEAIFRTADDLTATLAQSGNVRRALRVGALSTLSRNFLIGFVTPLIGRRDVELVLRSGAQSDLIRGLEALSLDIVLTNVAPARDAASPYLVQALTEQPVSVVGFPRDTAVPLSLTALLTSEPLILPTPESALRAAFDGLIERLGVVPHIAAEADDMATLRLLARAGAGLAVLPPIVVQDELRSGLLVERAQLQSISEWFLAVTLRRRFPNPLVAEVLGMVNAD
ncbi:MAG: LysR family transcriptional regulator [Roseovarius sp. BRH_c41]|uniref:LysR family transcriptional regulator n=1 Tax=Roseovarius sp. BRH_c41 TaxID=1629709 RepID=UPI0005F107FF|nr:LysR family transcriptional regulator [Roseovarius sp. BRH_c41]KJS43182.1 MAG: LysR family transcriptional regulator [Roseovarius sp. BRH_c41]